MQSRHNDNAYKLWSILTTPNSLKLQITIILLSRIHKTSNVFLRDISLIQPSFDIHDFFCHHWNITLFPLKSLGDKTPPLQLTSPQMISKMFYKITVSKLSVMFHPLYPDLHTKKIYFNGWQADFSLMKYFRADNNDLKAEQAVFVVVVVLLEEMKTFFLV